MPHNKPDLVIWNWETKLYTIVCLLNINAIKKVSEKLEVYALLIRNLEIMYAGYKFEIALGFEGKEIKLLIRRTQVKFISGSVKICKMFLSFNDFKKGIQGCI